MKRSYGISDLARAQLEEIYDYTEQRWGESQADKYFTGLIAEIEKRTQEPEFLTQPEPLLAKRIGADPEKVRSFLYEKHRCYFTFDDVRLRVLMVVHGARDKAIAFQELAISSSN